jgi:phosphatidate cytidylyltransferase
MILLPTWLVNPWVKTSCLKEFHLKRRLKGLLAVLAGVIISQYYVTSYSFMVWMIIAVIVSVFGTIGDLVESKFKRLANVKDSGNIMPGHGGVYDRLDSIIFVAPFVFLLFKILEYVS